MRTPPWPTLITRTVSPIAVGPVYIEGAEPGDVLVVDIHEVKVADEGTIATDDHCGPLFETTGYRTKKIPIKDGMATFNQVSFPINPMIGVIVPRRPAPTSSTASVGSHGGNMDNKKITQGHAPVLPRARSRRASADGRRARHHGRR